MEEDLEDVVSDPTEKKAVAKVEADPKETKDVVVSQPKPPPGSGMSKGAETRASKSNAISAPAVKEEEDDEDDEDDEDEEEEEHALVKAGGLQEDLTSGIKLEEETEIDESQVRKDCLELS